MSDTPSAAPQLEGRLFLFNEPQLLSKEKHANLGLTRPENPFAFCTHVSAVPLVISELGAAQRYYPIIFSTGDVPLPMAVVGLIDDFNLFVDDEGNWEQNVYLPRYLRRYPFALAGDQQNADRMAMVIDASYNGLSDKPDVPFFEDGELSGAVKNMMEYCANYERDRQQTMAFGRELAKYDVLSSLVAQFTPEGQTEAKPIAQYTGVEEKKLAQLSDEDFLAMRKSNVLPLLYAQLMSMANWASLMERRMRRHNLTNENMLDAITKQ